VRFGEVSCFGRKLAVVATRSRGVLFELPDIDSFPGFNHCHWRVLLFSLPQVKENSRQISRERPISQWKLIGILPPDFVNQPQSLAFSSTRITNYSTPSNNDLYLK
jgi:hypothetical protein